jgi:hypothetical protein
MGASGQDGFADFWVWLSAHPQLLLIVLAGGAWAVRGLNRLLVARDKPPDREAAEAAERTRRAQEQVRRLIEERRGNPSRGRLSTRPASLPAPSPTVAPRPIARPIGWPLRSPQPAMPSREQEPPPLSADTREAAGNADAPPRPDALEGILSQPPQAGSFGAPAVMFAPPAPGTASGATSEAEPRLAVSVASDLRNAGNLRRAVLWREILGPPVGLR